MRRFWFAIVGALASLTLILEVLFRHHAHPHFWWHATPLFDLLFGFAGCAVIILVSKWLGHAWLQREETYYGNNES